VEGLENAFMNCCELCCLCKLLKLHCMIF